MEFDTLEDDFRTSKAFALLDQVKRRLERNVMPQSSPELSAQENPRVVVDLIQLEDGTLARADGNPLIVKMGDVVRIDGREFEVTGTSAEQVDWTEVAQNIGDEHEI